MKRRILAAALSLGLLTASLPAAGAVSLLVNGSTASVTAAIQNQTTYVPLRAAVSLLLPNASVSWEDGRAVVRTAALTLTAKPGDCYLTANGRVLYIAGLVQVSDGSVLVPVRVLARALGASVEWDGQAGMVSLTSGSGTIASGDSYYNSTSVYWLSRIIEAESSGEPMLGKLAVGCVVLNRVASADFPDTIYDVIFDTSWGGQFEPVSNGTIYNTPSEESILAAKLCLDGASVVGESLYFLNPAKSTSFWAVNNAKFVATIGSHDFYA